MFTCYDCGWTTIFKEKYFYESDGDNLDIHD